MSEILHSHNFKRGSKATKRDWTLWGDGQIHKLKQGEDFQCTPGAFDRRARRHAVRVGVKVRVSTGEDFAIVQFYRGS